MLPNKTIDEKKTQRQLSRRFDEIDKLVDQRMQTDYDNAVKTVQEHNNKVTDELLITSSWQELRNHITKMFNAFCAYQAIHALKEPSEKEGDQFVKLSKTYDEIKKRLWQHIVQKQIGLSKNESNPKKPTDTTQSKVKFECQKAAKKLQEKYDAVTDEFLEVNTWQNLRAYLTEMLNAFQAFQNVYILQPDLTNVDVSEFKKLSGTFDNIKA